MRGFSIKSESSSDTNPDYASDKTKNAIFTSCENGISFLYLYILILHYFPIKFLLNLFFLSACISTKIHQLLDGFLPPLTGITIVLCFVKLQIATHSVKDETFYMQINQTFCAAPDFCT
ncbi:hypothetical protein CEQ15_21405 [Chryseobacterium indologenes]|nr:hypothetical protein CEQ15_21405 [Chryseobacterium indologenes]